MRHEFTEVVLTYNAPQLEAWRRGDLSLMPPFVERHGIIVNQCKDSYHFGEFVAFDHYYRTQGWRGFRFFVLNCVRDYNHPRYAPGGRQIAKMVPAARLEQFRAATEHMDAGEPDLFLYKDSGEALFLEVKKGADRPDEVQLRCLAHLRSILGCRAELVYVREEQQTHSAKTYWVEIDDERPQRVLRWGAGTRTARRNILAER